MPSSRYAITLVAPWRLLTGFYRDPRDGRHVRDTGTASTQALVEQHLFGSIGDVIGTANSA